MNLENAVIVGDWHGDRNYIGRLLMYLSNFDFKTIISVGDVGFLIRPDDFTNWLTKMLDKYDMNFYFIDGNHLDYHWLSKKEIDYNNLTVISNRIKHIPRGHTELYRNESIVFVGGGVSVDKYRRKEGYDWFPSEVIDNHQLNNILNDTPVSSIMISHDCPSGFFLPLPFSDSFPANLIEESNNHRKILREIYDELNVEQVVCGHYHIKHKEEGLTVLDCNRMKLDSSQFVPLDRIIDKVKEKTEPSG